ncbi:hypothetical protein Barb7_00277 [Bacteroidales bacterium Barb7]|nr:hypothetical protein Barb7_00277 [Bacteroidales bacterium Barb7]
MKRLIIICEGETEQEFCKDVLYPYFLSKGIVVSSPIIKKSKGGIVPWKELKKQITSHLKEEWDVVVTTFIDFYGLYDKHGYPGFDSKANDHATVAKSTEEKMKVDINDELSHRFIPYIQLHEFECFMFCSLDVLKANLKPEEADFNAIEEVINSYPNPEDINNGTATAPSKRLKEHIPGYDKSIYGACLAKEIGLRRLREKCLRFNEWIINLEKAGGCGM